MAQNRPPPAYQEYAASTLANVDFRKMSLSARGLLYTLRLETWIETPIPSDVFELSQLLRFDVHELEAALREIRPFLSEDKGQLRVPELDDYRQHLIDRREKQSAGGKEGARRANQKKSKAPDESQEVDYQVTQGLTTGSLVKKSTNQLSSAKNSHVSNEEVDSWISEYETSEGA